MARATRTPTAATTPTARPDAYDRRQGPRQRDRDGDPRRREGRVAARRAVRGSRNGSLPGGRARPDAGLEESDRGDDQDEADAVGERGERPSEGGERETAMSTAWSGACRGRSRRAPPSAVGLPRSACRET